jgi:hypothetical protein
MNPIKGLKYGSPRADTCLHAGRRSRCKSPTMHVNLKSHVHRARKTVLIAKLARVDKTTIGPSKNRRFSKTIVGRSPHSEISTDWNSIKQLLTPEELQAWRGEKLKYKQRRERQQKRQLASRAMSSKIPYERSLSRTSPDQRLDFLPVASIKHMSPDLLHRLQDIEQRVVEVLPESERHKFAGNKGHSVGLTAVSGGTHARGGKSGSIHLNPHLKRYSDLQEEVVTLVRRIILDSYGHLPWFVELTRRLEDIPDHAFLPGARQLPASHIWLTNKPKMCHVHCDSNALGATFIFASTTVDGGELVIDRPVQGGFQVHTHHLTAGKILGGSWGQYAHCNLPLQDFSRPRRSWVVYLDYRSISRCYINKVD